MTKRPAAPGRPTIFSLPLAKSICGRIANGESLRAICRERAMPSRQTVLDWLASNEEFLGQYARAREAQCDLLAEEILEIADTPQEGVKTKDGPNGTEVTTGDMIEHRRLQVDARKWFASKVAPKKYGDRVQTEVSGPGGGPIEHKDISDIDAARRIAWLLQTAVNKKDTPDG